MRKWMALLLAGTLTLSLAVPALARDKEREKDHKSRFEVQFKDWDTQFWGNESLARMVTKGVIKGNGDGTVAANRPVSRLEAAIMVARLLDLEAPQIPRGEFKLKAPWGEIKIENEGDEFEIKIKTRDDEWEFEDDDDVPAWGREAILIGLEHGFLIFDGARLNPMSPLNRLEAAIMLVKAAGMDEEAQNWAGADLSFTDASKIPQRLQGYIAVAVEQEFVTGYENGSFMPHKPVTRAEWATLLDRLDRDGAPVSADGRQVKGMVTAVNVGTAPSIAMTTPVFPNGVTYPVDDTAVFYKNRQEITIADISAGDQVIINLSPDRQILMVTVHNLVKRIAGQVSAYTEPTTSAAGSITVTDKTGVTTTHALTVQTAVRLGESAGTLADLLVGDQVKLTLEGAQLTSIMIKVEAVTVTGSLSAITQGVDGALPTLTVVSENSPAITYTVADYATISGSGETALTLTDLQVGDLVTLRVQRGLVVRIALGQADPTVDLHFELEGRLVSIDTTAGTLVLTDKQEMEHTLKLATDVRIKGDDDALAVSDLELGDRIVVKGMGDTVHEIKVKE